MDRTAVVKVGAAASASVCALFGGVVLAQYIVAKKKRAGKKTRIIEMVSHMDATGVSIYGFMFRLACRESGYISE
uniref:Uncharacterized protein n=1 Tax=Mola mola TaxID=94237 RepID=A0A3Q3VWU4_MOLML